MKHVNLALLHICFGILLLIAGRNASGFWARFDAWAAVFYFVNAVIELGLACMIYFSQKHVPELLEDDDTPEQP